MLNPSAHYDIVVAGAGFAGSLTALALHNCGFKVCVIEKGQHPRFALGESSTPIADMILRNLSKTYNLPWLYDFSRYGSWQQSHPEVVCGLKRGFSYYKHFPGQDFFTDANHTNELLVAASSDDLQSDTNWLREDIDAFLATKLVETGVDYFDNTEIISAVRTGNRWNLEARQRSEAVAFQCSFFIDASGGGALSQQLFAVTSAAEDFQTNSFAVFTHFDNFPRWTDRLKQKKISTRDYPYDPDDSALHHVLDEGWIWALRFNTNRTSWGFTLQGDDPSFQNLPAMDVWKMMLSRYPDIKALLKDALPSSLPGGIFRSGRLQRKMQKCFGNGWVAMPHTVGFVDPLFSTGIAYSLAGIERIVKILSENRSFDDALYEKLGNYECAIFEELELIDLLVAGCYKTMSHFPLFNAWSMLYFTFTITYEQRLLKNLPVGYFLEADKPIVKEIVYTTYKELLRITNQQTITASDYIKFTDQVRERIKPFNTAGLLDPSSRNMYFHTVAVL